MHVLEARSPRYADTTGTAIDILVLFDGLPEVVPFTATPDDIEVHGRELYQRAIGGEFGPIDAFEPTPTVPVYPQFTALEMLDLFTEAEQLGVVEAAMTVPAVKLWYDRLIASTYETYEDPRVEQGLQVLVTAGLISPTRKAEFVLAMQPKEISE